MRFRSPRRGTRLAAIVLAAGASNRLGRSKQLLRLRAVPLLVRAVRLAASATDDPVIVVTGAQRLRIRSCLRRYRLPVRFVFNRRWPTGMASSLATGIGRLPKPCSGVLVMLTDQARLDRDDIRRLVGRWRQRPLQPAAAVGDAQPGVPAVLPRRLFAAIRELSGDQGARQLLRGQAYVTRVPMPNAVFDVDTAADINALQYPGAAKR